MNDEPEEVEPTEYELRQTALDNLQAAIEDVLSFYGEDNTSILTDWAVCAVSQAIMDDGRHVSSPTMLIVRDNALPIHRVKGLLVDALDELRSMTSQTTIVVTGDEDGDDDD